MGKLRPILVFTLLLALWLSSFNRQKPQILIIGDSISIGYTPFVQEGLKKVADVFHNPGNAQHTGTGLEKIEEWVGDGQWDVIQFNWGLWDLCYRHPDSKHYGHRDKINGKITYGVKEYGKNLDSIITVLRQHTDARLIFLTTTYIPEHEAGRYQEDVLKYNRMAKKIMKDKNVLVNEVFEASKTIHEFHGKGTDDVHYDAQGYEQLGELVSIFLKKELQNMNISPE